MIKITNEQLKAVFALNAQDRYSHSIKMIADREEMFSLLDSDGNWELAEIERKKVFFLWPAEEYVLPFMKDNWKNSSLEKITIEEFENEIATFLNEHEILLNVFSIDNLSGFVVTTEEFKQDLEAELKNYE